MINNTDSLAYAATQGAGIGSKIVRETAATQTIDEVFTHDHEVDFDGVDGG